MHRISLSGQTLNTSSSNVHWPRYSFLLLVAPDYPPCPANVGSLAMAWLFRFIFSETVTLRLTTRYSCSLRSLDLDKFRTQFLCAIFAVCRWSIVHRMLCFVIFSVSRQDWYSLRESHWQYLLYLGLFTGRRIILKRLVNRGVAKRRFRGACIGSAALHSSLVCNTRKRRNRSG